MFGVADHVHVEHSGGMETINDMLGGYANGGHEKLCTCFYNDADQFLEVAFCIVVASKLPSATQSITDFLGLCSRADGICTSFSGHCLRPGAGGDPPQRAPTCHS